MWRSEALCASCASLPELPAETGHITGAGAVMAAGDKLPVGLGGQRQKSGKTGVAGHAQLKPGQIDAVGKGPE